MNFTRRQFVKGGVSAFTVGFAAPQFLTELALAQAAPSRNLVVLYLGGGNDALSTLIPYRDAAYYSRRPTLAIPAGNVIQIGTDSSGVELGLHPRLTGLKSIFDEGRLAIMQRTGYQNSSRSHFQGFDIWGTANPTSTQGTGWLGRYLDTLPSPVDPLVGWNTTRETPRPLMARTVGVPAITNPATYAFSSPNSGTEAVLERTAATKISSHLPVDRPHLSFVNSTAQAALGTLDQVARVASYTPSLTYPNNGLGQALRAVAGAMNRRIGTKVFWVQTGGFDTHSGQGANQGAYVNLMGTLNDSVLSFYQDLNNQGLLGSTLVIVFSEFGRRINENGSAGTDHGAAGVMMALGGGVRGGIFGTAADLRQDAANPHLENNAGDVKFETDFRSVYAKVLDNWLGSNSVSILGADFKAGAPNFL
ncbi:MAG TPA: DUF1501 domain-containing protein [Vicinamibacterales bacterium]|nr:DUF1501 domain-containing protein [Vicinamibacterales bacterium]